MRYAVWGLRCGSGTEVRIHASHRYRSKARYRTATDYGPSICTGPHSVTYGTRPHFNLALAHQNKAAGWPDLSPVLGSGPSRTGPSHPGITFARRAMPTMKGAVQEDDYQTEVRLKDKKIYLKSRLSSSGSQSTRICKLRIRDSDLDLNPDPGLNRWHQSGGGSAAHRWIRPGLRYH